MYLERQLNVSPSKISQKYFKKKKIGRFANNLSRVLKGKYESNHLVLDSFFHECLKQRKKMGF